MRRFPLYAKILLWCFLNLVLLAAVFYLVFRAQFPLRVDWLLSGSAAARVEAVSRVILVELADRPRSEWDKTLQRFGGAYQVQFCLFNPTGGQLAGENIVLPSEVKATSSSIRGPRRPRRGCPQQHQNLCGAGA